MLENTLISSFIIYPQVEQLIDSSTYALSFNYSVESISDSKETSSEYEQNDFSIDSSISEIIIETYKQFQQAVKDSLFIYKTLNKHNYNNLNKCEEFFNLLLSLNQFSMPIIILEDDSVKADIFYCGNKFSLKVDFDCPDILFIATFKKNKQGKKTLFVNECKLKDYKSIFNFIFESNYDNK